MAAFFDRHGALVNGFLSRMIGRGADVDDLLQETFWHVWKTAQQFDGGRSSPKTWLILIARSRALDFLRKKARSVLTQPLETADTRTSPDGVLEDQERQSSAKSACLALENLPIEQRRAIQWAFFNGYTHTQIAEVEGVPLGTVKTRIRLGMIRLRDILGSNSTVQP